jgi:cell division protein ZapD
VTLFLAAFHAKGFSLNDMILYEFPLNERIRLFIRLEQLFQQLDHHIKGVSSWDCRAAIMTLLELLSVFGRTDVRSEAMQEIDRQTAALHRMTRLHSGIDQKILGQAILDLEALNRGLYKVAGKLGQTLLEDEFLKGVIQRGALPGGSCSFDVPAYHHWLNSEPSVRRQDLMGWIEPFNHVRQAIDTLMNFIRTSANASREFTVAGFYQKSLDHTLAYQLLRVFVPKGAPYYAEISGGKHRFTIRFMVRDIGERPLQVAEDLEFRLSCCLF